MDTVIAHELKPQWLTFNISKALTHLFCHWSVLPFAISISAQSFLTDINSSCISILRRLQKVNIFRHVSTVQWIYQSHIFSFFLFTKVWLYSIHLPFHIICGHALPTAVLTPFVCRYHRKLSLPAAIIAYLMNHAHYHRRAYCKWPRLRSYSEVFTTKPSYIL